MTDLLMRFREVCDDIEAAEQLLGDLWPQRRQLIREMAAEINPATGRPWSQRDLAVHLDVSVGLVHHALTWKTKKLERAVYYEGIANRGGAWARKYAERSLAAYEEG